VSLRQGVGFGLNSVGQGYEVRVCNSDMKVGVMEGVEMVIHMKYFTAWLG